MMQTKFVLHLPLSEKFIIISFTVCVSYLSGMYRSKDLVKIALYFIVNLLVPLALLKLNDTLHPIRNKTMT